MTIRYRLIILITILLLPLTINAQYTIPEYAPTIEDLSDSLEFFMPIEGKLVYNDSLARIYPAYELYHYSWTPLRVNPYHVSIDSMPDSVYIDCRDFVYPTNSNRITSDYGWRRYRYHHGTDIGLNVGDTIRAMFAGRVRIVDYERRGYGHYVVIRYNNGLETVMAHMSRVLVQIDQDVKAGQIIGFGGNTGHSTGPHLHLELRFLGNSFNPVKMIDFEQRQCLSDRDGFFIITKKNTYKHKEELQSISTNASYHRVRAGETLSHIARRYHTTVKKLCKLNHIRETSILRIGQKIRYR